MTAVPDIRGPTRVVTACIVALFLALFVAACSATTVQARQSVPAPRFERFSVEDGLSQSSVLALHQDSKGFIWVGTQSGLNRFDGYRFLTLGQGVLDSTRLSVEWISALHEDAERNLWIATMDGGLNRLDLTTAEVTTWRSDPEDSESLPHDIVSDIERAEDGALWVATYGGLARLDPSTGRFDVYESNPEVNGTLPDYRVLTLATDTSGTLWVGTDLGGLYRFDAATETFEYVQLESGPERGASDVILTLYADRDGSVWAGTAGRGLFHIEPESGVVRRFSAPTDDGPAHRILQIIRDDEGVLRVGTDGAGIGHVDEERGIIVLTPESLSHDVVNALLVDRTGQLWAGTTGGGLNRHVRFQHLNTQSVPPLSADHVMSIHEEDDILWLGTDGGGLDRIDLVTGERSTINSESRPALVQNRVMGIESAGNGRLWLATAGGLQLLDPDRGSIRTWVPGSSVDSGLRDNRIMTVEPSGAHPERLWVGTWNGLHAMDTESGTFEQIRHAGDDASSISNNRIISLLEDSHGTLWVGTFSGGLNRMKNTDEGFDRFATNPDDSTSLSNDIVSVIHEARDGSIWVGTADGLNRFLPDRQAFKRYSTRDGLPDNTIYGILEDQHGRLWLSTNRGLAVLDPDDGTIRTFASGDGLQNAEFNQGAYFTTDDGVMLFGGINGVNRFDPEHVLPLVAPPVTLTALSTVTRSWNPIALPYLESLDLHSADGAVSFEFSALDFRNPDGNVYGIRLEGEDEVMQMRSASQRFGSYSHLDGGTYRLRITAAGPTGVWNADGAVLDVQVIPPIHETTWFRLLAGLIILGGLTGIGLMLHRRRLKVIDAERREEQEIHRRLMDSREAERLFLAQELHDGAVQDLYGVRFRIGGLAEAGSGGDGAGGAGAGAASGRSPGRSSSASASGTAAGTPSETEQMVSDVIKKLRQICGELRPPVLAPFGLERTLRSHADSVRERVPGLDIRLDLDADGQSLPEPVRLALFRVVQEALNNVIKHAEASNVLVRLKLDASSVDVSIEDDGKGFVPPESWIELGRKDHFGLLGLSERVRAIGGRLSVDSEPGKGTRVHVHVSIEG